MAAERATELRSQLLESSEMPSQEAAEKLADSLKRNAQALQRLGRGAEADPLIDKAERLRRRQD